MESENIFFTLNCTFNDFHYLCESILKNKSCKMDSQSVLEKSAFHNYIEGIVRSEFEGIKYEDDKSIVIASLDETENIFIFSRGSKENVSLAICELFHNISKRDRVYLCEIFAEMLDTENAEYVFNSIKRRADFDSMGLERESIKERKS